MIPAELRKRYGLGDGAQVIWLDTGDGLTLVPVSADPVSALRGSGKGEGLLERLLADRARGRARE